MPFDLKNLNPPARFWLNKKEWVEFRVCAGTDLDTINDQTTAERVDFVHPKKKNGRPDRRLPVQRVAWTEITDQALRNKLLWDFSIADWYLVDTEGNEIPCTTENKIMMMGQSAEFATWAADCFEKIDQAEKVRKDEQEKN